MIGWCWKIIRRQLWTHVYTSPTFICPCSFTLLFLLYVIAHVYIAGEISKIIHGGSSFSHSPERIRPWHGRSHWLPHVYILQHLVYSCGYVHHHLQLVGSVNVDHYSFTIISSMICTLRAKHPNFEASVMKSLAMKKFYQWAIKISSIFCLFHMED